MSKTTKKVFLFKKDGKLLYVCIKAHIVRCIVYKSHLKKKGLLN